VECEWCSESKPLLYLRGALPSPPSSSSCTLSALPTQLRSSFLVAVMASVIHSDESHLSLGLTRNAWCAKKALRKTPKNATKNIFLPKKLFSVFTRSPLQLFKFFLLRSLVPLRRFISFVPCASLARCTHRPHEQLYPPYFSSSFFPFFVPPLSAATCLCVRSSADMFLLWVRGGVFQVVCSWCHAAARAPASWRFSSSFFRLSNPASLLATSCPLRAAVAAVRLCGGREGLRGALVALRSCSSHLAFCPLFLRLSSFTHTLRPCSAHALSIAIHALTPRPFLVLVCSSPSLTACASLASRGVFCSTCKIFTHPPSQFCLPSFQPLPAPTRPTVCFLVPARSVQPRCLFLLQCFVPLLAPARPVSLSLDSSLSGPCSLSAAAAPLSLAMLRSPARPSATGVP
jgi:hypothetical protein